MLLSSRLNAAEDRLPRAEQACAGRRGRPRGATTKSAIAVGADLALPEGEGAERSGLPTVARKECGGVCEGAPGWTRTSDPRLRSVKKGGNQGQREAAAPIRVVVGQTPEATRKRLEPPRIVCHLSVENAICDPRTNSRTVAEMFRKSALFNNYEQRRDSSVEGRCRATMEPMVARVRRRRLNFAGWRPRA